MHVPGVGEVGRFVVDGIGPDGDGLRFYHTEDNGEVVYLPSVTSVLSYAHEDKSGIENWKKINDGEGDNADWKHLLWYKTHRGTLCHYAALAPYQDGNVWSDDEEQSAHELVQLTESEVEDIEARLALYSLYKSWGFVESKFEFIQHVHERSLTDPRNRKYCVSGHVEHDMKRFKSHWDEAAAVLGIDEDSVVDAERFLFNEDLGVAGQVDLVYDAPDGKRVCADIKTSSRLYRKHRRQAAFYAQMHPADIDRIEVIKVHPHKGWEVFTPPETAEDRGVLTAETEYSKWEESRDALWADCARAIEEYKDNKPDHSEIPEVID